MDKPVLFGTEAADQIREVVRRVLADNVNGSDRSKWSASDYSFFALPMCGTEIPAATDSSHPGSALCCLFILQPVSAASPDGEKQLVPVREGSVPYKVRVYNTYSISAVDCNYIPVTLTDDGSFIIVNKPSSDCEHAGVPGSHTTRAPTTTTPNPATSTTSSGTTTSSICRGKAPCRFTWGASSKTWTKDSGCEVTTSTTSTTTTATTTTPVGWTTTSSTTTTCACANPDAGSTTAAPTTEAPTSTSSSSTSGDGTTTTSSTTTTRGCECEWPTFCGTADGQCTITRCSTLYNDPPECGQTTTASPTTSSGGTTSSGTTTCNCGTSTTTTDGSTTSSSGTTHDPNNPNRCEGCSKIRNGYGPVEFTNGCSGKCVCPTWTLGNGAPCSSVWVPCYESSGGGGGGDPCRCKGTCGWQSSGSGWKVMWDTCDGDCGCHCEPPDGPADNCGSAITPCGINH